MQNGSHLPINFILMPFSFPLLMWVADGNNNKVTLTHPFTPFSFFLWTLEVLVSELLRYWAANRGEAKHKPHEA